MGDWLLYGANGYTGELLARMAAARGERPILAGRNAAAIAGLGRELGLTTRAFPLDQPGAVAEGLKGVHTVLHCAGPFRVTARPMFTACVAAKVNYLDITGEIEVFEHILGQRRACEAAGMTAIPGVGFDVVPTDCLAARLKRDLPDAIQLRLAFKTRGSHLSRGTARTMIAKIPEGGMVRRDGKLVRVPLGYGKRTIEFVAGGKQYTAIAIPWGDVSTAFHTTGIPNIEVYTAVPQAQINLMRIFNPVRGLMGLKPVQHLLGRMIDRAPAGPDASARESGEVLLWGEAENAAGRIVVRRFKTGEGYALTAHAALAATLRVHSGSVQPGAYTPALAFGPDFIDEFLTKGIS